MAGALAVLFAVSPLLAADWPPAIAQYEALALQQPGRKDALWQVWRYALSAGRVEELKERWKAKIRGPEGGRVCVLLGLLCEMEFDDAAAREFLVKATQIAPQDAAVWRVWGQFESERKTVDAQTALARAIELGAGSQDSTAVEMLVDDHLAHGRRDEARALLDRALAEAKELRSWRSLGQKRTQVAFDQGQLARLIARIEASPPRAPAGASELAEVYFAVSDYAQARVVLDREHKARPAASGLRTQAIAVATATSNDTELARLLKEEAEAEPRPEAWRQLFQVLVKNGSADDARALLAVHGADLAAEPLRWREWLPQLWQLDLARPLLGWLEKTAAPDDWETAILSAELLIAEGDRDAAEAKLWTLFEPRFEAKPIASWIAPMATGVLIPPAAAAIPEAAFRDRQRRLRILAHWIPAAFAPEQIGGPNRLANVQTVHDVRDLALLYLAMIAADAHRAPAFLEKVSELIAMWSAAERIVAWSTLQNAEGLFREITSYAAGPRREDLDRFCFDELARMHGRQSGTPLAARAAALKAKFSPPPQIGDRKRAAVEDEWAFSEASRLFGAGQFADATANFEATARYLRRLGHPNALYRTGRAETSFGEWAKSFTSYPQKQVEAALVAVSLACARGSEERVVDRVVGERTLWAKEFPGRSYQTARPGEWQREGQAMEVPGQPGRLVWLEVRKAVQVEQFPPPDVRARLVSPAQTLFASPEFETLWAVFCNARGLPGQPAWPMLKEKLDALAAKSPPDQAPFVRAATAYLAWWQGEEDDAMARMWRLVAESDRLDIRLGLAAMLLRKKMFAEADALLAESKLPYPAYKRAIDGWRLRLALEAGDHAKAKALADELATWSWELSEMRAVAQRLKADGSAETAERFCAAFRDSIAVEKEEPPLATALGDWQLLDDRREAVATARKILARPPAISRGDDSDVREAALQALGKYGERESYLADLAREAQAASDAIEVRWRLAEAGTGAEAVAAWERVLEIQPGNRRAARQLASHVPDGSAEQRRVFARCLAVDPEEALLVQYDRVVSNFEKSGELPRLAELIAQAPFRRHAAWRSRDVRTSMWGNLAQKLVNARQREAALAVLRRAVWVLDPVPPELRRMFFQQLVAAGHREEAGQQLLARFSEEQSPLVGNYGQLIHPTLVIPFNPDTLELAQTLGVGPELRAIVEKAAATDPEAKRAVLSWRAKARDSSVLSELPAVIEAVSGPVTGDRPWLLALATELAGWPEAVESCRKLLAAYERTMEQAQRYTTTQRLEVVRLLALVSEKEEAVRRARAALQAAGKTFDTPERWRTPRMVGEFALAAGDAPLVAECSRVFAEMIASQNEERSYIDEQEPLKFAGGLIDAGRDAEAREILAVLRSSAAARNNADLMLRLKALEMDWHLRRGEWWLATPVVWLDAARTTPEQAALVWDLGVLGRPGGDGPQPLVRGEAMPALDGRLTVELFFGEDVESMQPVARLTGVGARGVWQGRLPMAAGFARAVLSEGDRVLFGEAFAVCAGRNLLQEGDAGKFAPSLPAGETQTVKGGPAIEGEYVSFRPADPNAGRLSPLAVGPRVRVQSGRDYLISGWLRVAGRSARLGWRCLDRDGKSVGNGEIPSDPASERFWARSTQRLNWPRDDVEGQRLPAATVYIEPIVEGGDAFDLAGLSLVEISPRAPAPEP